MTSTLPARPDLEHLRRDAKRLLDQLRARDAGALARVHTHAPGLPVALSTAQLVIARELGFPSWAQLKTLVTGMASHGVRYDHIGPGYSAFRRPDPRIAEVISRAIGDARTVVNVGAGTGSYEPTDRPVIPVEPSTAMAVQRDPTLPPAVLGVAESLPLADHAADAAMAMLTMHHWADISRGLSEMRRVVRKRIVLLTIDVEVESQMWLLRDYVPQLALRDRMEFPTMDRLCHELGEATTVTTIPVPADCHDGFLLAFWSRPEAVLDPQARAATSGFARMNDHDEDSAVARLKADLGSGRWDDRYGELRATSELDVGLRLVVSEVAGS
jgi:SAM-dependent methyltransferase